VAAADGELVAGVDLAGGVHQLENAERLADGRLVNQVGAQVQPHGAAPGGEEPLAHHVMVPLAAAQLGKQRQSVVVLGVGQFLQVAAGQVVVPVLQDLVHRPVGALHAAVDGNQHDPEVQILEEGAEGRVAPAKLAADEVRLDGQQGVGAEGEGGRILRQEGGGAGGGGLQGERHVLRAAQEQHRGQGLLAHPADPLDRVPGAADPRQVQQDGGGLAAVGGGDLLAVAQMKNPEPAGRGTGREAHLQRLSVLRDPEHLQRPWFHSAPSRSDP